MRRTATAIRNAALTFAGFFGRFGDLGKPKKVNKYKIGGTMKFKELPDPYGIGRPDEETEEPQEFRWFELPAKGYTFREWHNYWRQYLRRAYWMHKSVDLSETGKPFGQTYRRERPHLGKKATRAAKRAKVAAMKAAGHFRGNNEEFIYAT